MKKDEGEKIERKEKEEGKRRMRRRKETEERGRNMKQIHGKRRKGGK